ncbi:MAG TPA: cytochrome c oxidase assembly protein [Longimicrobiaceae bacterium]|nr:cytochrome c oxidase assembly protein [Longimicrobiaceae bacterium]
MVLASIQWWCSAQGIAWEWKWRSYPGVWLFVALVALGYYLVQRSAAGGDARSERFTPRQRVALFAAALLLVWGALDWPIGTLAAGYMATFHQVQLLLLAYIAPPLLILSLPVAALQRARRHPRAYALLRLVTQPLVAALIADSIILATHLPQVVDGLMATQLGSFAFDFLWLGAGLLLWWPVVAPVPERPGFEGPFPMMYLFFATTPMIVPAAFMTYAPYPLFTIYEFAPRVYWISAVNDQRFGGLIMWIVGSIIIVLSIAVLFFQWAHREEQLEA